MIERFIWSFHFYNCKDKEKTDNDCSVSHNLGSCPLTVIIASPSCNDNGINWTKFNWKIKFCYNHHCSYKQYLIRRRLKPFRDFIRFWWNFSKFVDVRSFAHAQFILCVVCFWEREVKCIFSSINTRFTYFQNIHMDLSWQE